MELQNNSKNKWISSINVKEICIQNRIEKPIFTQPIEISSFAIDEKGNKIIGGKNYLVNIWCLKNFSFIHKQKKYKKPTVPLDLNQGKNKNK